MAQDNYYAQTITRSELLARPGWTETLIKMLSLDGQQTYALWIIERHEQNNQHLMRLASQAETEGWAPDVIDAWRRPRSRARVPQDDEVEL